MLTNISTFPLWAPDITKAWAPVILENETLTPYCGGQVFYMGGL